jgi:hypothetical protein
MRLLTANGRGSETWTEEVRVAIATLTEGQHVALKSLETGRLELGRIIARLGSSPEIMGVIEPNRL